jgi:hypothetical protein
MPITRSEVIFFAAGVAAGVAARAAFPEFKEKVGPLLAGAGAALGDAYIEVARRVAEKVESVQDSVAEKRQHPPSGGDVGEASAA